MEKLINSKMTYSVEISLKDGPASLVLEHREGLPEAQRSEFSDLIPRPVPCAAAKGLAVIYVAEISEA